MEGMIYLLRSLGDKLGQDRSNGSLIAEDRIERDIVTNDGP